MSFNISKYHAALGPKKWVLWLFLSLTVGITILVVYYKTVQRGKLIGKLRTEADLASLKAEKVRYDLLRAAGTEKVAVLLDEACALQTQSHARETQIKLLEKANDAELKKIQALKSWRDLDEYNRRSR
jgi:hypothetical protein